MFECPVLNGDIGGTISRFTVPPSPGEPLSLLIIVTTSMRARM